MRVTIEDGVQPSNVVKRESMYDNGKGRMIRTNGTRLLLWSVKRKLHVLRRTVTFQMTLSDPEGHFTIQKALQNNYLENRYVYRPLSH